MDKAKEERSAAHLLWLLMFCQLCHLQPFNNGARETQPISICFYLGFQGICAMQALFLKEGSKYGFALAFEHQ